MGDSRAYRMRDGELEQLTRDHSLVAELERSGQITAEAAEHHPQRSIITRALGPEPDVEVDTYTLAGRERRRLPDLLGRPHGDDLRRRGRRRSCGPRRRSTRPPRRWSRAANQSGGKDNITVVLFRLGEGVPGEERRHARAGTRGRRDDRRHARTPTTSTARGARRPAGRRRLGRRPSSDRRAGAASRRRRAASRAAPPPPPPGARAGSRAALAADRARGRDRRRSTWPSRQVYFVGTNDGGLVTLYRGMPYDLPLGINLYQQEYASAVPARRDPRGAGASGCSTTSGAAAATRSTWCGRSSAASSTPGPRTDVRAHARAVRPHPGVAARGGGFAAVLVHALARTSTTPRSPTARSSSACACSAHLFIRARLPDADPYMFPLAALLAGIGLVLIYRIDAELAREQAQWFVVGLALLLRDDPA